MQIVCKYVNDPVLLERDDIGPVKFDLRFVVMVTSVCPLQLAVHQKFIVRVANKSVMFSWALGLCENYSTTHTHTHTVLTRDVNGYPASRDPNLLHEPG